MKYKEGDWIHFSSATGEEKSFGYLLEDQKPDAKLKVHLIKHDMNTHRGEPYYRYIFSENVKPANKVPNQYADRVQDILKPLFVDFCLKTRNDEALKRFLKGDTVE